MRGRRKLPGPSQFQFLTSAIRPAPKVNTNRPAEAWVEEGWPVGVSSSWVSAIRYDKTLKELFVGFNNGVTVKYLDVDVETAKDMFNANSMGMFIDRRMKNFFTYLVV